MKKSGKRRAAGLVCAFIAALLTCVAVQAVGKQLIQAEKKALHTRVREAAISCYEQFSPAPPELKQARTGFAEVNALRIRKLKEAQPEFTRCKRIGDERGMLHACQDIMKITGERSKAYREAAEILRQVKRQMNAKKR